GSMPIAAGVLLLQTCWIVLSGYLLGMALSVFALGPAWRDTHLMPVTRRNLKDPESYLKRVGDHTLVFWVMVTVMVIMTTFLVQIVGRGYYLHFPTRGYHLVSFRGNSPAGQQRAI